MPGGCQNPEVFCLHSQRGSSLLAYLEALTCVWHGICPAHFGEISGLYKLDFLNFPTLIKSSLSTQGSRCSPGVWKFPQQRKSVLTQNVNSLELAGKGKLLSSIHGAKLVNQERQQIRIATS